MSNFSSYHKVFNYILWFSFIYKDFQCLCVDVFNIVCCRFIVCGKGLNKICSYIYITKKFQVAGALLKSGPTPNMECKLYVISMTLSGAITDEQNTRGRKIYAPEESPRGFGILTPNYIPLVNWLILYYVLPLKI